MLTAIIVLHLYTGPTHRTESIHMITHEERNWKCMHCIYGVPLQFAKKLTETENENERTSDLRLCSHDVQFASDDRAARRLERNQQHTQPPPPHRTTSTTDDDDDDDASQRRVVFGARRTHGAIVCAHALGRVVGNVPLLARCWKNRAHLRRARADTPIPSIRLHNTNTHMRTRSCAQRERFDPQDGAGSAPVQDQPARAPSECAVYHFAGTQGCQHRDNQEMQTIEKKTTESIFVSVKVGPTSIP